MAIRRKELGVIPVDCGDVVCFPIDSVVDIMRELGVCNEDKIVESEKEFIQKFKGVACEFRSDGCYGIDKVSVVDKNGDVYDAVLVGAPEDTQRFLDEDDPTFDEFAKTRCKDPDRCFLDVWSEKDEVWEEYARFLKGVSDERAERKTKEKGE